MEIILWTVEQTVRSRTNRELAGRSLDSKHRGPASVLNISLLDEDQNTIRYAGIYYIAFISLRAHEMSDPLQWSAEQVPTRSACFYF